MPITERGNAYLDMAMPIGDGQTISPPFIVAYMTEQLDPQPTDTVLEIGTGSGYQAAILSPLVKDVYSIEIVKRLGDRAARTLKRLGYKNIHLGSATVFRVGPRPRRSTRSSSPVHPKKSLRRWSTNARGWPHDRARRPALSANALFVRKAGGKAEVDRAVADLVRSHDRHGRGRPGREARPG